MSVICGAIKKGLIAISGDTMQSFGSMRVSSKHRMHANKIYPVNGSYIGIVGWNAISDMLEHIMKKDKKLFCLNNRMEIYTTLMHLHAKMKGDYFIETKEDEDQPVESNQLDALIINPNGLFQIGSYREVHEYKTFWAIGSGRQLAMGAMHALYEKKVSAKEMVEAGVKAAADFDDSCGLPLKTKVIKLAK